MDSQKPTAKIIQLPIRPRASSDPTGDVSQAFAQLASSLAAAPSTQDSPKPKRVRRTATKSTGVRRTDSGRTVIAGSNNVVGNNNQVNINVRTSPAKPVAIHVQPGAQHISDEQAYEISSLVTKVVEASGRSYPFVWGTLKKKFVFSKYQLLTLDKYEPVRTYLRSWIASSSSNGAPSRNKVLARIQIESKKVPGLPEEVHRYIEARFSASSLAQLTVGQLLDVVARFNL